MWDVDDRSRGSDSDEDVPIAVDEQDPRAELSSARVCVVCDDRGGDWRAEGRSTRRTARFLVATSQWNFYYCYACRSWFRIHYRLGRMAFVVRKEKLVRALEWYVQSEAQALEDTLKVGAWIRAAWEEFARFYLGTVARLTK